MVKQKIIGQQPKTIENPKIVDKKLIFIEHPKTSYKLSIILKYYWFCKNSTTPLYSDNNQTIACL